MGGGSLGRYKAVTTDACYHQRLIAPLLIGCNQEHRNIVQTGSIPAREVVLNQLRDLRIRIPTLIRRHEHPVTAVPESIGNVVLGMGGYL